MGTRPVMLACPVGGSKLIRGQLVEIDAVGPVETVSVRLAAELEHHLNASSSSGAA